MCLKVINLLHQQQKYNQTEFTMVYFVNLGFIHFIWIAFLVIQGLTVYLEIHPVSHVLLLMITIETLTFLGHITFPNAFLKKRKISLRFGWHLEIFPGLILFSTYLCSLLLWFLVFWLKRNIKRSWLSCKLTILVFKMPINRKIHKRLRFWLRNLRCKRI